MRLIATLLLAFAATAAAAQQYAGPGVDACLAQGSKEVTQPGAKLVIDRDRELNIERYTKKVGSQFVSSLLYGNGAIIYPRGAPVELSFVCLLASDRQAVFFYWQPRTNAAVLAQCRRGANASDCMDSLMQVAEQDLTQIYAKHFVEAREVDSKAGNETAVNAFRRSADTWKAYRDAECARRNAAGSPAHKACFVELTQQRARDLR
jgi:uncharacterized protein YecT (DUF1311 family)